MRCTEERPGEKRDCPARGSIEDGVFRKSVFSSSHNHKNNHESQALSLLKYAELKRDILYRRRIAVRVLWREWIFTLSTDLKSDYNWSKVRSALYTIRSFILPPCPSQAVLSHLLANNVDVKENYGMFNGERFFQRHAWRIVRFYSQGIDRKTASDRRFLC